MRLAEFAFRWLQRLNPIELLCWSERTSEGGMKKEKRETGAGMPLALTSADDDERSAADAEEFRRYEAALRSYFRLRAPTPQVDDLVQEALARLIATRRDTQVQTPLAYLFRIASNLLADRARAQRRAPTLEWDDDEGWEEQASAAPEQECGLFFADLERSYAAALDELSSRCREVFLLRRHGELSTADVAERFGISHRMVQKYMVQALELLSVRLRPFLEDIDR